MNTSAETQQENKDAAERVAPDGIEVWVCPNPSCGQSYHSSAAGDLSVFSNTRTAMRNSADEDPSEWGKVTGYRNLCQFCKDSAEARANGGPFARVRVLYIKASRVEAGPEKK